MSRRIAVGAAIALATLTGLLAGAAIDTNAAAHHTNPYRAACAKQLKHHGYPGTGITAWRKAFISCLRARTRAHARYIAVRRCRSVGLGMPLSVCRAYVDAARRERLPVAWAYDPALHRLIQRESGFDKNAVNDSSNACGFGQHLPCPWKFTVVGWSNGRRIERVHATPTQIARRGLRYIDGRYYTPGGAWRFWLAHHWY